MNAQNIISFIQSKSPKYDNNDYYNKMFPFQPVEGRGYRDENGDEQGEWVHYRENVAGEKSFNWGNYINGVKHGKSIFYRSMGIIDEIGHYNMGVLYGPYEEYHRNGNIARKGFYKNNMENGTWEFYDENGKLTAKGEYKKGAKFGEWKYYNPTNGTVFTKNHTNI